MFVNVTSKLNFSLSRSKKKDKKISNGNGFYHLVSLGF